MTMVFENVLPEQRAAADAKLEPFRNRAENSDENSLTLPLGQACSSQFGDRTIFATCRGVVAVSDDEEEDPEILALGPEARMAVTVVEHFYAVEDVYGSDEMMRSCMADGGGAWNAMPRDAPEVRRALRAAQLNNLQQQVEESRRLLQ